MRSCARFGIHVLLSVLVLSVIGPARAVAQQNESSDMMERLSGIEQRIADLQHQDAGLSSERAAAIQGLVADVLDDADQRAALQNSGATSGHDGGFFVASTDGNFRLNLSGYMQFRHVYNNRNDSGSDDDVAGFDLRRVRLKFAGHIVDPSIQYVIGTAFSRTSGALAPSDVFIEKDFGNGTSFRVGRFHPQLVLETLVSAKRQIMVDRSLIDGTFGPPRLPGLGVFIDRDDWRLAVALHDQDPTATTQESWLGSARVEYLLHGTWRSLRAYSSKPGSEPAAKLGAAIAFANAEFVAPAAIDTNTLTWTADLTMQFDGSNLAFAVIGNHIDNDATPDRDQYMAVAQGGMFVSDSVELTSRLTWGDNDGAEEIFIIEVGVNKYISGHDIKIACDVGYGVHPLVGIFPSSSRGWLADAPNQDGQIVVRTQLQLVF